MIAWAKHGREVAPTRGECNAHAGMQAEMQHRSCTHETMQQMQAPKCTPTDTMQWHTQLMLTDKHAGTMQGNPMHMQHQTCS